MPISLRKALLALQIDCSTQPSYYSNISTRRHSYQRRSRMQEGDDVEVTQSRITRHKAEIVVISDDEDVENWPPPALRRRTRPLSTDSVSGSSSAIVDGTNDRNRHRHHVSKRRKAEHGDSIIPERIRKAPLVGHDDGYTKADVSFSPNGSHANLLFKTGDYTPVPPLKTSIHDRKGFVQGSVQDPFTTTPAAMDADRCPWYFDDKLEVKMYRGLGYDRFPVVLGTVKGHQAICDKWQADKNEQHEEDQLYIASLSGGINPFSISRTQNAARMEKQCLREVQAVFPQVQQKFVLEKYRARRAAMDTPDGDVAPSAVDIISEIAELDTYPQEEAPEIPDEEIVLPQDGTGVTIAYKKDIPKDETYRKEALRILAEEFTHIPSIAISRVLEEKQSLFDAFVYFNQAEATYFDVPQELKPYRRSKLPRRGLEAKYQRGSSEPRDGQYYANLINELQAAKQHYARELYRLQMDQDREAAEVQNLVAHKLDGSLVECQTCFDDEIPMNRAIMCEGDIGHFFCFGCVARLAESQIGAMKHEMTCMDGSGCKAILSIDGVGRAVATKVVDKLAFYQQQAEISAAGIEGLEQCPHCEYKAICDPIEEDSIFMCQNPDCGKNSCRKCSEASHLPKTCEEAKKDKGLSARHLVEEARSEAMMRKCPKCKAKIIKELGCNKMVCSCGNMMCYVCQQDISGQAKDGGYQHFHKGGAKCPLYDAQGTERHDQDADAAEKAAIKKVKAQEGNEDLDDKELQIETGKDKSKPISKYNHPPPAQRNVFPGLAAYPGIPFDMGGLAQLAQLAPPPNDPNLRQRQRLALVQQAQDAAEHRRRLQERLDQLRAADLQLQRERHALNDRRMDDIHRTAQDARQAALVAQANVNRMMGAGFPQPNMFNQNHNQMPPMPGNWPAPYAAQLAPAPHPLQQIRGPLNPDPAAPAFGDDYDDEIEMLLFGPRRADTNANGNMNENANVIANQPQNQNQQLQQQPRTTVGEQEELDNLDFGEYVARGPRHRR